MAHQAFDRRASEYDAWYDTEAGRAIFSMEVECLQPLLQTYSRPYLEIGVGSGRFAQALGIEHGVEPAPSLGRIARLRGVGVTEAAGEGLPFRGEVFGAALTALTLCFVDSPLEVLQEAWRVLKPGGGLVLGLILRGSPWAEFYTRMGREGHPIYSRARFFSRNEVEGLLRRSGFAMPKYRSTLFQPPGQDAYRHESTISSFRRLAGFVAIASAKTMGLPDSESAQSTEERQDLRMSATAAFVRT